MEMIDEIYPSLFVQFLSKVSIVCFVRLIDGKMWVSIDEEQLNIKSKIFIISSSSSSSSSI